MDYDVRIGKIEATLEANQRDIDNLRQEMRQGFARHDQAISDLRKYVDQRFGEVEQKIDDLRQHTDQRLDELRRDMNKNMHWLMGIWLTTMGLVASMAGRMFGLY